MTNFINFGCWNKNGCAKGSGIDKVISLAIEQPNIDFFIVNGDNYYQDKDEEGNKNVNNDDLIKGFDCLNKTDKEIFLLIGNHDIEYTEKGCDTIGMQKDFIERINAIKKNKIHFPYDLTMFKEIPEQKTLIIMIDSNIYTDENPVCYNEFINGIVDENLTTNKAIIDFLQKKQEVLISTFLEGK